MTAEPTIIPSEYTYVFVPEGGDCLDLTSIRSKDPIRLAPGSIPRRFKFVVAGPNITTLEEGVIHSDVEILMVHKYTEDMVLPDSLKVLMIHNFSKKSPIPKSTIQRIIINRLYSEAGDKLGTHWLYSNFNLEEPNLQEDKYDIEELDTMLAVGSRKYYTVKRIPKKQRYSYPETSLNDEVKPTIAAETQAVPEMINAQAVSELAPEIPAIQAAVDLIATQLTTGAITDATSTQIITILKQLQGSVDRLIDIFTTANQSQ